MVNLLTIISTIGKFGTPIVKSKMSKNDRILAILKELGLSIQPTDDFESIYAHTLVTYGVNVPDEILNFFRNRYVQDAFKKSFYDNNPNILDNEAEGIIQWNDETRALGNIDYDPRREFSSFTAVFNEIVSKARTPWQARMEQGQLGLEQKVDLLLNRMQAQSINEPSTTYDASLDTKPESRTARDWKRGELIYELVLPDTLAEENLAQVDAALLPWRFISSSPHPSPLAIQDSALGVGGVNESTFNLAPVSSIVDCSIDCELMILDHGNDQSNWAGIQVRAFDFAIDFRLGYLVYLRRSCEVELYTAYGIIDGDDRKAVDSTNGVWTHIRIDILGQEIQAYVNGVRHISQIDQTFGGKGVIYLHTYGTKSLFKNFKVYRLSH
jgi:hypothetical protein